MDRLMAEHEVFNSDLVRSGHLLDTNPLERVEAAATVRVRNGTLSVTDGPFAETKEQLGGYYLIEARDLNEAVQVAARIPVATRAATIEVRPIRVIRKVSGV
jgi:hypothetical protein